MSSIIKKETNVHGLLELVTDANHSAGKNIDNQQLKTLGKLSTEMRSVKPDAYV
jgi:hypothetical protein